MELKGERRGNVAILTVKGGILTREDSAQLEKAFAGLRSAKRNRLVIDASGLEHLTSLAIGQMVGFAGEARKAGGIVAIASPQPAVLTMLRALGVTSAVPSFNTLDEAVATCEGQTPLRGNTTIIR